MSEEQSTSDTLRERLTKIDLMTAVVEGGDAIRLATWKAEAQRNPESLQQTMGQFGEIVASLEQIRPMTTKAVDLERLDTIEQAVERSGTKAGNKGEEAAMSALEMVSLMGKLD